MTALSWLTDNTLTRRWSVWRAKAATLREERAKGRAFEQLCKIDLPAAYTQANATRMIELAQQAAAQGIAAHHVCNAFMRSTITRDGKMLPVGQQILEDVSPAQPFSGSARGDIIKAWLSAGFSPFAYQTFGPAPSSNPTVMMYNFRVGSYFHHLASQYGQSPASGVEPLELIIAYNTEKHGPTATMRTLLNFRSLEGRKLQDCVDMFTGNGGTIFEYVAPQFRGKLQDFMATKGIGIDVRGMTFYSERKAAQTLAAA